MRRLNTAQKIILTLGILGFIVAVYGRFNGWEYNDYFVFFYTSTSFMWIAFLDTKQRCHNPFKRKKTDKALKKA